MSFRKSPEKKSRGASPEPKQKGDQKIKSKGNVFSKRRNDQFDGGNFDPNRSDSGDGIRRFNVGGNGGFGRPSMNK